MEEFLNLLKISDQLLGPQGCSWDKEQTLFTLQPYLMEETHELLEAIDSSDPAKIADELGDVLYALVFIAKLGERQGMFSLSQAIQLVCDKLIRRHPHVFGDTKVSSTQDIVNNWEAIKKTEKTHETRKNLFDGIPAKLPLLPKAQKMAKRLQRNRGVSSESSELTEEQLGQQLWTLIQQAESTGLDAESALRRKLRELELSEQL